MDTNVFDGSILFSVTKKTAESILRGIFEPERERKYFYSKAWARQTFYAAVSSYYK